MQSHSKGEQKRYTVGVHKPLKELIDRKQRDYETKEATIWRLIDRQEIRTDLEYELLASRVLDE